MRVRIQCLTAVLVALACSGIAFGQTEQFSGVPADQLGGVQSVQVGAIPAVPGQWGNNVLVTSVLTRGQTLEVLFSNNLLVSDMVTQWKANFLATPPAVPEALEIQAALQVLVRAFAADRRINWTAQDVLVSEWANLPGGLTVKKKIRAAFEILKADGLMCLSFLNRAENEEAPQELVTAMVGILENPRLCVLTHMDLYSMGATLEEYSDADMDLLIYAMDDVQLIRTEAPDRYTETSIMEMSAGTSVGISGGTSVGTLAAAYGYCCNRTTRACVIGAGTAKCSMCNVACCLGSSWCPF